MAHTDGLSAVGLFLAESHGGSAAQWCSARQGVSQQAGQCSDRPYRLADLLPQVLARYELTESEPVQARCLGAIACNPDNRSAQEATHGEVPCWS